MGTDNEPSATSELCCRGLSICAAPPSCALQQRLRSCFSITQKKSAVVVKGTKTPDPPTANLRYRRIQ
jgi:hypothetical protein